MRCMQIQFLFQYISVYCLINGDLYYVLHFIAVNLFHFGPISPSLLIQQACGIAVFSWQLQFRFS